MTMLFTASFFTLEYHEVASWKPINIEPYKFDISRQSQNKRTVRFVAETVSMYVNQKGIGPVTGSAIMYTALKSFKKGYDSEKSDSLSQKEFSGSVYVYLALKTWDDKLSDAWLEGFKDDFKTMVENYKPSTQELGEIHQLIISIKNIRSNFQGFDFSNVSNHREWTPELGVLDNDAVAIKYPSVFKVVTDLFPAPPSAGSSLDQLDITQFNYVVNQNNQIQGLNSVFWQGSSGFAKNSGTGGFNPSDILQNVAFHHLSNKLNNESYINASVELAEILYQTGIEVWKKKYLYQTARPSMRLGKLQTHIGNPPFPGYPSGHAAFSSAAATYLSYIDPENSSIYKDIASDAAKSRAWGGVHLVSDNYSGAGLGELVAYHYLYQLNRIKEIEPKTLSIKFTATEYPGFVSSAINVFGSILKWVTEHDINKQLQSSVIPLFSEVKNAFDIDGLKVSELTQNDIYSSGIALGDIDGDQTPEVLFTGKDKVYLFKYNNTGENAVFTKLWEKDVPGVEGAIYLYEPDKKITGLLVMGRENPFILKLSKNGLPGERRELPKLPLEKINSKWAYVYDFNHDGLNDIYLQEFVEARFDRDYMPMGNELKEDVYLYQNADGSYYIAKTMSKSAATSGAGMIDINGDNHPEEIIVLDGALPIFIDGKTRKPMPLDPSQTWKLSGMSFTPIKVKHKGQLQIGIYISDISTGDHWRYRNSRENKDKIVIWDKKTNLIKDIAQGMLNGPQPEWSWGGEVFDFNHDGLDDIAIVSGFSASSPYACNVRTYIQSKEGVFIENANSITHDLGEFSPRSIVGYDFDKDGDKDILISGNRSIRYWENEDKRANKLDAESKSITLQKTLSTGYSVQKLIW